MPRYFDDLSKFGSLPTTYINGWFAEGIYFLPWGNTTNYPVLVMGLVDPNVGWAPGNFVHYGGEGEMLGFNAYIGGNQLPSVKVADMNLITYEYEPQTKLRDTYLYHSAIALADDDAPQIVELPNPSQWTTGAQATIPTYAFQDLGLGVRSVGIRLPGETSFRSGWGADFGCLGTALQPCQREVKSSEAGKPGLAYVPSDLPTGIATLEVMVGDPTWQSGHVAAQNVEVKVDNSTPELSLSGPLTEQGFKGTLSSEYELEISAEDGDNHTPQSGIAKVEVKVDGTKITMGNEAVWHPNCQTQNCSFAGTWTLKASDFEAGSHEVEVVATDAAGLPTTTTLEIDLGPEPLQTSFTTPHPTHTSRQVKEIGFKAMREGSEVQGATFKCAFGALADSASLEFTACTTPYEVPDKLDGWQIFKVAAVDDEGNVDPTPATWSFEPTIYPPAPAGEKLLYPETGKKSASYFTLQGEWQSKEVTGISFEMQLPDWDSFEPVPAECTIDGQGNQVSWPLAARSHPGRNKPVFLRVRGCPAFATANYRDCWCSGSKRPTCCP